jgi:hypothetical protein
MVSIKYRVCAEHPGIAGSLDCDECIDGMRMGQRVLREFAGTDDSDTYDDPTLNAVIASLGWRTEKSTLPGRKRVFDEWGMWLNIWSKEEIWEELRKRGLKNGRKP